MNYQAQTVIIPRRRARFSVLYSAFITALLGVFLLQSSLADNNATATMFLQPATANVTVGDTFPVAVRVNTNAGLVSVRAHILFSEGVVSIESVNSAGSAFQTSVTQSRGNITINGQTGNKPQGNLLIATINFKATSAGQASAVFGGDSDAINAEDGNDNILRDTQSGTYNVAAKPTPPPGGGGGSGGSGGGGSSGGSGGGGGSSGGGSSSGSTGGGGSRSGGGSGGGGTTQTTSNGTPTSPSGSANSSDTNSGTTATTDNGNIPLTPSDNSSNDFSTKFSTINKKPKKSNKLGIAVAILLILLALIAFLYELYRWWRHKAVELPPNLRPAAAGGPDFGSGLNPPVIVGKLREKDKELDDLSKVNAPKPSGAPLPIKNGAGNNAPVSAQPGAVAAKNDQPIFHPSQSPGAVFAPKPIRPAIQSRPGPAQLSTSAATAPAKPAAMPGKPYIPPRPTAPPVIPLAVGANKTAEPNTAGAAASQPPLTSMNNGGSANSVFKTTERSL